MSASLRAAGRQLTAALTRLPIAAAADRLERWVARAQPPDFAGLIGVGGYRFIGGVAARYDLPLGEGFHGQLEWLCRVLTLTWLAEAAGHDPVSIPKQLSWVSRAFGS